RGGSALSPLISTSSMVRPLPFSAFAAGPAPTPPPAPASSTMVFHSPQLSHRPAQRGVTAPQDWQTKVRDCRAMGFFLPFNRSSLRGGPADEAIQGRQAPGSRPLDCFAPLRSLAMTDAGRG